MSAESLRPADDKMPGTIQTFEAAEHYGTVALDDARTVTFGRSNCVGFEPFPGLRVGVAGLLRDATGQWTARELTLEAHPTKAPPLPVTQAESPFVVDLRRGRLGWFSVLLGQPLPESREAIREGLEEPALGKLRVVVRPSEPGAPRELELLVAGQHLLALEVAAPPAREGLDLRQVPAGFPLGTHRVELSAAVLDPLRLRLAQEGALADPWGAHGHMRVASLLVRRLLALRGVGVVLHFADGLVLSKEDMLRRLSQLENPECRPFGAWVDWVLSPDRRRYRSVGMNVMGGMDVELEILNPQAEVELDSAESAVLYACMLQARENRLLAPGEVLYVPKDIRVGPFGATARERTGYKFTVEYRGEKVELVRA